MAGSSGPPGQDRPAAILFVDQPMTLGPLDLTFTDGMDCTKLLLVEGDEAANTVGAGDYDAVYAAPFMDRQALVSLQRRIAGHYRVVAVLGFTELSVYPAAVLAEAFGVVGIGSDRALACRDKALMAEAFARAGLARPQTQMTRRDDKDLIDKVRDLGGFPVVCKPRMGFASCGVMLAADEVELRQALRTIVRLGKQVMGRFYDCPEKLDQVLLQSFLPGEEVAVDGFVEAGAVQIVAMVDKPGVSQGPVFPDDIYLLPSKIAGPLKERIENLARQAVVALGLDNTAFHLEVRLKNGEPHILEIAARIGCLDSIERALGLDLCAIELDLKLGRKVDARPRRRRFAGQVCINAERHGTFRGLGNLAVLLQDPRITAVPVYAKPGQRVAPPPLGNDYIGFIMATADSYDDAKAALEQAAAKLEVLID